MKMRSIEKLKKIQAYLKRRAEKRELLKSIKRELIATQVSKIVIPDDIAAGEYKSCALYEMTRYTGSIQTFGKKLPHHCDRFISKRRKTDGNYYVIS